MAFGHILLICTTQLLVLVYGQPTTNYADPEAYHQHNSDIFYSLQELNQKVDIEMLKYQQENAEMAKTLQELQDCLFNGSTKIS